MNFIRGPLVLAPQERLEAKNESEKWQDMDRQTKARC